MHEAQMQLGVAEVHLHALVLRGFAPGGAVELRRFARFETGEGLAEARRAFDAVPGAAGVREGLRRAALRELASLPAR